MQFLGLHFVQTERDWTIGGGWKGMIRQLGLLANATQPFDWYFDWHLEPLGSKQLLLSLLLHGLWLLAYGCSGYCGY